MIYSYTQLLKFQRFKRTSELVNFKLNINNVTLQNHVSHQWNYYKGDTRKVMKSEIQVIFLFLSFSSLISLCTFISFSIFETYIPYIYVLKRYKVFITHLLQNLGLFGSFFYQLNLCQRNAFKKIQIHDPFFPKIYTNKDSSFLHKICK